MADHIQIHQGWMRNFQNDIIGDNKQVWYLNLKNNKIDSIKIKELGALDNFYVKDFEKYLSDRWETKFGEINKKLVNSFKRNNASNINLDEEEEVFLNKFMAVCIGRSNFFKKLLVEKSLHPFKYLAINEITPAAIINEGIKLFENKDNYFIYNNTNLGFVLPSYSYYYFDFKGSLQAVFPLTNKISLIYIEKGLLPDKKGTVFYIDNENDVFQMNKNALLVEKQTNNDYIIAKNKNDLEKLL